MKDLQEEISRSVLSQESLLLSGRDNRDSYSRDKVRGPILDEFSEDARDYRSSKSNRNDYRDSRDQQLRKHDDSRSRKRSYSPADDRSSSSYRKSREDTPTKRSRSTTSSNRRDSDDDLRNVLKQYQKSKWEDEDVSKDRTRYNSKDFVSKVDGKRNKESLGVSSSTDIFTMSSQGTLGSFSLESLPGSKDYFDAGFREDYREKDWLKEDKKTYRDSLKDRDYTSSRYRSSKQDRRGRLDYGLRYGPGHKYSNRDEYRINDQL